MVWNCVLVCSALVLSACNHCSVRGPPSSRSSAAAAAGGAVHSQQNASIKQYAASAAADCVLPCFHACLLTSMRALRLCIPLTGNALACLRMRIILASCSRDNIQAPLCEVTQRTVHGWSHHCAAGGSLDQSIKQAPQARLSKSSSSTVDHA